jgi:hypothetical protein
LLIVDFRLKKLATEIRGSDELSAGIRVNPWPTSAMRQKSIFCVLLFCAAALGQTPGRIVTTTRLVTIFSQLEKDWLKAVQQKDEASLNRLLTEDFEVWTPAPPGDPTPREEWLRQALAEKIDSFRIRQMAVKGLNDNTAIASFVLSETVEHAGKPLTRSFFIVDVWEKKNGRDESWQATERYLSEVKGVAATQQGDVKPTGKN